MKITISGGAGFIGSHLCEELINDNHDIFVLTKGDTKLSNLSHILDKITIERIDITNFEEVGKHIEKTRPEIFIHLAGQTSHSKSFENPLYDIDVNTKSTLFILEKIRTMNLKCRFILGSTFVVIGKPSALPVTEDTPCNPTSIYGANRLASENYCKIYHNVYGLDTLVFRITNSFGPREQIIPNKNAVNFLIHKAFKGEEITIYDNGNMFRDLIYISDVISGINTIMNNGQSGNTYWISSGTKTWFHELGDWLHEFTNSPLKYVESPKYTKKVDVGNFLADNSKLISLGWKPKTTIKEGIRKTLDFFNSSPLS